MAEYTDPELRQRLKEEIQAGDRGGRPGQWSARKAQLLVQEYERHGGGYIGERDERQRHLRQWEEEDWHAADGSADAGKGEHRYLPDAAWKLLTPKEREATERVKHEGREQFVANTDAAKAARKVMHLPDMKADEARRFVRGLDTPLELRKAEGAERARAARKTVLEAIERRRRG
jgi:hypothetical protein